MLSKIKALEAELACAYRELSGLRVEMPIPLISLQSPVPTMLVGANGLVCGVNRGGQALMDALCPGSQHLVDLFHPRCRETLEHNFGTCWEGVRDFELALSDGRPSDVWIQVRRVDATLVYELSVADRSVQQALHEMDNRRTRSDVMGYMARSVARDLNDPMAIVEGRLELLLQIDAESRPELLARSIEVSLTHARRMSRSLHNLRLIGRQPDLEFDSVCLREVCHEAIQLLGRRGQELSVERLSPEPDQLVGGSAAVYARVFSILFRSIADSRFASDVIGLEYERRRDSAHVVVAPVDTLRSLNSWEDAERVSSGDEALLDWDVVLTLLESLGVSLTVRSVGVNRIYCLTTPLAPTLRVRAKPVKESILVVGKPALARAVETFVGRDGFRVRGVTSGRQALEVLSASEAMYVVVELMLPDVSAPGLVNELQARGAGVIGGPIIISSVPEYSLPSELTVVHHPLSRMSLLRALGVSPRPLRNVAIRS